MAEGLPREEQGLGAHVRASEVRAFREALKRGFDGSVLAGGGGSLDDERRRLPQQPGCGHQVGQLAHAGVARQAMTSGVFTQLGEHVGSGDEMPRARRERFALNLPPRGRSGPQLGPSLLKVGRAGVAQRGQRAVVDPHQDDTRGQWGVDGPVRRFARNQQHDPRHPRERLCPMILPPRALGDSDRRDACGEEAQRVLFVRREHNLSRQLAEGYRLELVERRLAVSSPTPTKRARCLADQVPGGDLDALAVDVKETDRYVPIAVLFADAMRG